MTYDSITKALEAAGFSTYYRKDSKTLICSSSEWPNVPQNANSFWVAKRGAYWFIATWAPHVYRIGDEAKVPELCITLLREKRKPAQFDLDNHIMRMFRLNEIDPDELPSE